MRSTFILFLAFLTAASGCTTAGPRVKRGADGWETVTTYACDWKEDGNWLRKGCVANSPVIPYTRGDTCRNISPAGAILLVVPFVLDVFFSPVAYFLNRDCRAVNTERRYVGTPAENQRRKREVEASARREREERERREKEGRAAQLKREEEAAKQRAEAAKLERDYPPLNESPKAQERRPDDFALVVGIEGYRRIPKADYGENDAKAVKTYLEAAGVPAANVILLTGQDASRADLAKYLEEWLPGVVKPGSRVYFYYSGHGAPDPQTGAAYLVPWDGDPAFLKSTAYPLSKVYSSLAALPAKESVALLDSCFSGTGGRSVLAPGVRPLVNVGGITSVPEKTAVLAAAGPNEIAGALELRKHGLFTYFLLRGLDREADLDGDGHVTLGELSRYLQGKVNEAARRSNRDQTPRLGGNADLRIY